MGITERFDDEAKALLERSLKGVPVYDSVVTNNSSPVYVVFHGGSEVASGAYRDMALVGRQDDAFSHPFAVAVYGQTVALVNGVASEIKRLLIGATLVIGSSGINIGVASSHSDFDAGMRPIQFVRYLTFTVKLDRSA